MDSDDTVLVITITILLSLLIAMISLFVICNMDYDEKLNEDIEDTVTGTEGGVEYHVSTAGIHREDDLLRYISDNNGAVIAVSYSAKGHEATTTVMISWSKVV